MAFALVNSASKLWTSGTSVSLPATSLTAGNLIVITYEINQDNFAVTSITDTAGNTYASAGAGAANPQGGRTEIWYAKNVTGNGSNVVTVNWTGAPTTGGPFVTSTQWSGGDTVTGLGVVATGTSLNTGVVTSGSFTPADASSLGVAVAGNYASRMPSGWTITGGWTSAFSRTPNPANSVQYNLALPASPATATATATGTPTNDGMAISVAVFKPAGGGGGGSNGTVTSDASGVIVNGQNIASSKITVTGTTGGSAIVGGFCSQASTVLSAAANTTFDKTTQDVTVVCFAAAYRLSDASAAGGDITLGGATTTGITASAAAIELLGWPSITESIVPQRHIRIRWNPDRTHRAHPIRPVTALVPTISWVPSLPQPPRLRLPPQARSCVFDPMTTPRPIIPRQPPRPSLPDRARLSWAPPRGLVATPIIQSIPQIVLLTAPATALVGRAFTCTLTYQNFVATKTRILTVTPFTYPDDNAPVQFGTVSIVGLQSLPSSVTVTYPYGMLTVPRGVSVQFQFDCVVYAAGPEQLGAYLVLFGGTEVESNIVTIQIG